MEMAVEGEKVSGRRMRRRTEKEDEPDPVMKPATAGAEMNSTIHLRGESMSASMKREVWDRDEPETEETDSDDDDTAEKGEDGTDDVAGDVLAAILSLDVSNNLGDLEGHDSDGTDGDILGRGEEGVDHDTDEGRVETELGGEGSDLGVGLEGENSGK